MKPLPLTVGRTITLVLIVVATIFASRAGAQLVMWTPLTPTGRSACAMVYDSARGVTVLFGGVASLNNRLGDTWEWNGTAWTQRAVTGPSPRSGHAMVYDSARGVTVLFGGNTFAGYSGETWEWNG